MSERIIQYYPKDGSFRIHGRFIKKSQINASSYAKSILKSRKSQVPKGARTAPLTGLEARAFEVGNNELDLEQPFDSITDYFEDYIGEDFADQEDKKS